MTDYRGGNIHGWNGGECPVHLHDEVQVWLRNDTKAVGPADLFAWVANLGLARLWCFAQDIWNWPSNWGRK